MNGGLRFLLRARFRGGWRRAGRRMRTFRGFVTTVFGAVFFLVVVGSQLMALVLDEVPPPPHDAAVQGFSLLMLLFLLPAVFSADAPHFWPAEVQFLFGAPLTRRELLLYGIVSRGWVQLFSGLWLGLVGMRMAHRPAASLAAVTLALLFTYALSLLAGLVKLAAGDRLPAWLRRAGLALAGVAVALAAFAFYRDARAVGYPAAVGELFRSPGMRAAMLPARPFAEVFAAESLGPGLAWAAASAGMVAAALAAVLRLDVDFRERSLVASARRFERLRRMRAGRTWLASTALRNRRVPVPAFRFLGPAGPLARRQAYELGRGPRVLLTLAFMGATAFFYVIVMPRWLGNPERADPLGTALAVLVVVFPVFAAGSFTVDFRRDVERMAYLRSLPLRPWAVAVGQVFVAAAVIFLANLLLLGVTVWSAGGLVEGRMVALAAGCALPVAWLAVTLENWLFLLFPARIQADGAQQSAFVGKQMIKLFVKLCAFGVIAAGAGVAAMGGRRVAGMPGAVACAAIVVGLACWGATLLLARAYRGFDLTLDAPG